MRALASIASRLYPHRLNGFVRLGKYGIPIGFALIAAPVFLIVGLLVVRAEQDGVTNALVHATETQNADIARTLANSYSDPISYLLALDIGDAPELLPIALQRSGLLPLIEASMRDTNVVNVKIYDGRGVTLFSLDRDLLGENISACKCFARVLKDGTFSELLHLGAADSPILGGTHLHADGEHDLFVTMIRLSVLAPDMVASDSVLEIQSDVTALVAPILATRQEVVLVVGIPLILLYVLMVVIVAFGHKTILRRDRVAAGFAARAAESEASGRAKSEFLGLMSHELRTPLNAIVGFAQLIGENSRARADDETAGWADAVHDSGLHMTRMISSILDMTALELGEFDLDRDVLHLHDVVRKAITTVRPAFDKGLVTLSVHDDGRQEPVLGDMEKLRQVFENLLSNAARHTPAGGTVDVTYDATSDGFASVSIRDTGVGMTKQQIEQARLPFHATWVGYSRENDGAGLGLTIADKVVKGLGGDLSIESESDVGTVITVRLPVCKSNGDNVTEVRPPEDKGAANKREARKIVA